MAITGSTTDGINAVLSAVDIQPGDEILTSDEEHPGVLGPIATARDTRGARVRVVPFADLPDEVRPDTRLVVTSHVSWATGQVMDTDPITASSALLVLDGAQGLGAVPLDVEALGCDFYAASGQKWLCGPGGIGYLYANPELVPDLPAPWSGYHALEDGERALEPALQPDARRLTTGFPVPHHVEWAHASLDVLEEAGLAAVFDRAVTGAEPLGAAVGGTRCEGGSPGRLDAGLLRGAGPPGVHRGRRGRGHRDPRPPGPLVRARVGRGLEQRRGDRAARGIGRRGR